MVGKGACLLVNNIGSEEGVSLRMGWFKPQKTKVQSQQRTQQVVERPSTSHWRSSHRGKGSRHGCQMSMKHTTQKKTKAEMTSTSNIEAGEGAADEGRTMPLQRMQVQFPYPSGWLLTATLGSGSQTPFFSSPRASPFTRVQTHM